MWWWMRLVVYIFKFSPLGSTVFPKSPLVIHITCEFVWGMSMESKIEWSSTLISVGNFLNGKKSHVHSFFFLYHWRCVCRDFSAEQAPQEERDVSSVRRSCFPCTCVSSIHFEHWKEIRANRSHFMWHYFQLHAHLPTMNCLFPSRRCAIFSSQHNLMFWFSLMIRF